MRNLAVKVPADQWPEFKTRVTACYQAPSRAIARDLRAGILADYADSLPTAVRCFDDDFDACIAHLRLPVTHRRSTRTTNLIARQQAGTVPGRNRPLAPSIPNAGAGGRPGPSLGSRVRGVTEVTEDILNSIAEIAGCGCNTPARGNAFKALGCLGVLRLPSLPVTFGSFVEAILSVGTIEHKGTL